MRLRLLLLLIAAGAGLIASAGEAVSPTETRVAGLIRDLDGDDFDARGQAERELLKQGAAALKPLQAALEKNESPELKLRLERIIPALKIATESDPKELAALAQDAASKGMFLVAARAYEQIPQRCLEVFRQHADSTSAFVEMRVQSAEALRRMSLMLLAQRSTPRISGALAKIYPLLKAVPAQQSNQYSVLLSVNTNLNRLDPDLDEMIKAIVDVCAASTVFHSMEQQGGKLVVKTVPEMHTIIAAFLNELQVPLDEVKK